MNEALAALYVVLSGFLWFRGRKYRGMSVFFLGIGAGFLLMSLGLI